MLKRIEILALFVAFIFTACTENPFWEEEQLGDIISGTVLLHGSDTPEQVYIWFRDFKIVTHPDADGFFEIPIPSIDSPVSGQSVSGQFPIFFYLNNYAVDSINVEFVDGRLKLPQTIMNDEFHIIEPIALTKLLDVSIEASRLDSVTLYLETTIIPLVDSVLIKTYGKVDHNELVDIAGVLLVNKKTNEVIKHEQPECTELLYDILNTNVWISEVVFDRGVLSGDQQQFLAIPYIVVMHSGIELIREQVGLEKEDYNATYLQLPFSRNGGSIEF